jgi:hypothetical protein
MGALDSPYSRWGCCDYEWEAQKAAHHSQLLGC